MKIIVKIFIDDEKLVMITLPKTIRVDLSIKINWSLRHDMKFIVRRDESLPEYTIKKKLSNYCSNMIMNLLIKQLSYLLESYCLKCRKNTESKKLKVAKSKKMEE